jgi:molecular chaperone GrpE (heat shock protein)
VPGDAVSAAVAGTGEGRFMKWFRKRAGEESGAETPTVPTAAPESRADAQPPTPGPSGAAALGTVPGETGVLPANFEVVVRAGSPAAEGAEHTGESGAPTAVLSADATGAHEQLLRLLDSLVAPGGAASLSASLAETSVQIAALAAHQEELKSLFDSRLHSDEVQAKALERLHDQLQDYKSNFIRQALLPVLKDIIYCYDFAASAVPGAELEAAAQADAQAKALAHLKQMLLDILFKYDVEPYRGEGEFFDRKTQQCVKTLPTDAEADDKKVAAPGVVGFRLGETIVRKEQVTLYKHMPAPMAAETAAPERV